MYQKTFRLALSGREMTMSMHPLGNSNETQSDRGNMRTFIINLARSADRRASIVNQVINTGVDFDLVEAIDGRQLHMTDPQVLADIAPSFRNVDWWRPALAACTMSHLNVYRRILAEGVEVAMVLEDDVQLPADLELLATAVAKHLSGAEVALLNFESPRPIKFTLEASSVLPSGRRLVTPLDVGQSVSGAAYVITRRHVSESSRDKSHSRQM